jgi:hypothetical protein
LTKIVLFATFEQLRFQTAALYLNFTGGENDAVKIRQAAKFASPNSTSVGLTGLMHSGRQARLRPWGLGFLFEAVL